MLTNQLNAAAAAPYYSPSIYVDNERGSIKYTFIYR